MAGPTGTFAPLDTPPVIKYNAKDMVALVYWGTGMSVRLFVFLYEARCTEECEENEVWKSIKQCRVLL